MILIVKFICLVLAIVYTVSNIGKMKYGKSISSFQFFAQAITIAGFIFLQFNLWR